MLKISSLKIWVRWGWIVKIWPISPHLKNTLSVPHPLFTCEHPSFSSLKPLWLLWGCLNPWRGAAGKRWRRQASIPGMPLSLCSHDNFVSIMLSAAIEEFNGDALFCGLGSSALLLAPGPPRVPVYLNLWEWVPCVGFPLLCWGAPSYFLLWNAIGSCSGFCPSLLLLAEWRGGTPFHNIVLWLV